MNAEELKARSKKMALDVIKLVEKLPKGQTTDVMGRQLIRSSTSLPQITVQPVEVDLVRISLTNWGLLRKRRTKHFFGLRCFWMPRKQAKLTLPH